MKCFKIKNIATCLALLGVLAFHACSDDNSYDFTGNSDNLVYLKVNGEFSDKTVQNQLIFTATQTPVGDSNDVNVKLPVWVTKQTNDIAATVAIDVPSVNEYNAKYNTLCLPLPDGMLILSNNIVTVKQGEYSSSDSIFVTMDNSKISALEAGKDYLAAIKLTSLSNNSAKISSNLNIVYFKIQVKKELAKQNVGSADMIGTIISDYSAWTYTSSNTTNPIANLWSASTTTGLTFDASPSTIVFNMNTIKKISGIRAFNRSGTSASNAFSNIKFSISNDNVIFTEIANFAASQMRNESGYQYISMYKGMDAQYIKLELSWGSSARYKTMVGFGVYVEN
ncbi:BT_3987 domain-containing protein [Dysgonomonas sp.]